MSKMKDYMDEKMVGVEEINLKQNNEIEQNYSLVLKNVDNGCGTKLDLGNRALANGMLTSFATLLGRIPTHEFIEAKKMIVAYLNEKQIVRMLDTAASLEKNSGTVTFIRELKFLLDCKHPEN